jgi:hypothetical protein
MTTKAATDLTFEEIQEQQVLVYCDEFNQKTAVFAPGFNRFQCGACKKIFNRSSFGHHHTDRKDPKSATGYTPRCVSQAEWDEFKLERNQGQVSLPAGKAQAPPKSVRSIHSVDRVHSVRIYMEYSRYIG